MNQPPPLLNVNDTILWLKVLLTVGMLVALYLRYRRASASARIRKSHSLRTKGLLVVAALFSFGVFHNLGTFRGGTFVHYGEMFHYYLGPKYFDELGYYELYNAVIAADVEQGNQLSNIPFYTDLKTYQNTQRRDGAEEVQRVRGLFSRQRWTAFKADVAFFKKASGLPESPQFMYLLMDHGYNGSPVSTSLLRVITNIVPVTQLQLLALLDVLLVVAIGGLVLRAFGLEMGALFSIYFCVNGLNAHDFVSGSLLRYDWLFCMVAAVCLLRKGKYALSAVSLTLAAMLRVFPAALFYGIAVAIVQGVRTSGRIDSKAVRFLVATGVTSAALFLLPAVSIEPGLHTWQDFSANTQLHNDGVYVNHLGLRGMVVFEPSHLSLERFIGAYQGGATGDLVRHWQDVKEQEFQEKTPAILLATLVVLVLVTIIVLRRGTWGVEAMLWPLLLVYTVSFPAHYYYAFFSLLILLFFSRPSPRDGFVPLCLLLVLNLGVLVTDAFRPSPIVFYTLVNIYLFACVCSLLMFEVYAMRVAEPLPAPVGSVQPVGESRRDGKRKKRKRQHRDRRK